MSDKRHSRGGNNPHMRTTEKRPCELCSNMANHYPDGTIEAHKVYEFKKVKGQSVKTTKWSYCKNKKWR